MYVLGFWANAGGPLVTLKNMQDLILPVGHTSVYLNPCLHVIQDMREELNKVHQLTMQCAEMGKLSTMQVLLVYSRCSFTRIVNLWCKDMSLHC
jgi:hypothetical protein